MTFLSILCALLIEQLKPLRAGNAVYAGIRGLATRMESWFNAGEAQHGQLAWCMMMASLMLPTAIIYWLLTAYVGKLAALCWNIVIVYLTLGLRHYSHYFTSIQVALSAGDLTKARELLAEWTRLDTSQMDVGEVSRVAVERALVTTHRNVFGVFFWFLMPVGPACAIMYRVAEYLARAWNEPDHMKNEAFGVFARRMFQWMDWLPVRLTAIAFAIVGNFEDAYYAWRDFAQRWSDDGVGIILSAASGAMGIRLGDPRLLASELPTLDTVTMDPGVNGALPGEETSARALQSTVGLVWRSLLLWMLMLLMVSIAVWLGNLS